MTTTFEKICTAICDRYTDVDADVVRGICAMAIAMVATDGVTGMPAAKGGKAKAAKGGKGAQRASKKSGYNALNAMWNMLTDDDKKVWNADALKLGFPNGYRLFMAPWKGKKGADGKWEVEPMTDDDKARYQAMADYYNQHGEWPEWTDVSVWYGGNFSNGLGEGNGCADSDAAADSDTDPEPVDVTETKTEKPPVAATKGSKKMSVTRHEHLLGTDGKGRFVVKGTDYVVQKARGAGRNIVIGMAVETDGEWEFEPLGDTEIEEIEDMGLTYDDSHFVEE